MKVICIKTLDIIEVDSKHRECSVCGVYHSNDKFNDKLDMNLSPVRTNCIDCYNLNYDDYVNTNEQTINIKHSGSYRKVNKSLHRLIEQNASSIPTAELIKILQSLPKDSNVVIKSFGYYCEGEYGEIHNTPKPIESMDSKLYEIGYGGSEDYC